jgi:hypothetical protein
MKAFKSAIILIVFFSFYLYSENGIKFNFDNLFFLNQNTDVDMILKESYQFGIMNNFKNYYNFKQYDYQKKEEMLLRRSEILFFGSLTFVTFGGWFFFSIFNVFIYNDSFGKIRREQFLPLYFGSATISISVVLSDLFINLKPRLDEYKMEAF